MNHQYILYIIDMKNLILGRGCFETLDIDGDSYASKFWRKWNDKFDMKMDDMVSFLLSFSEDYVYKMPFTIKKHIEKTKNFKKNYII